jgi:hypothetical protein
MKSLNLGRYAVSCVVAATLAACGGSQSPINPQTAQIIPGKPMREVTAKQQIRGQLLTITQDIDAPFAVAVAATARFT